MRPFESIPPVDFSVASRHQDLARWESLARGEEPGYLYARNTPGEAVEWVERETALLEGSECGVAFGSGMGAVSSVLMALLEPGRRVVAGTDTYGGVSYLFTNTLPKWGVIVSVVDTRGDQGWFKAIEAGCDLLYLETPSNPLLKVVDIGELAKRAHDVGALVVVDNTVATPINQRPLGLGADIVIHSATKFLGGHADAMGGVVATNGAVGRTLRGHRDVHGGGLDPMNAFLIARGLRTLELRMERHNENALGLARFLESHPAVSNVHFPGLEEHPEHALAGRQMQGFGALLSFELANGEHGVGRVLSRFENAALASTLGSVDTLVGTPSTTSHVECLEEERAALGIPAGLIRCSVGIEALDSIIQDFERALQS